MECNHGCGRLRGLCHGVFLGWRRLFNVNCMIVQVHARTNAQQNRSGARSLRTCWLFTCRCNLARTRLCVGCSSACNLHSSFESQSGERAAHSILSLAGQRANSNFRDRAIACKAPRQDQETSSTSYSQGSPLQHFYLLRRQLFHIEQLYLFGTWDVDFCSSKGALCSVDMLIRFACGN